MTYRPPSHRRLLTPPHHPTDNRGSLKHKQHPGALAVKPDFLRPISGSTRIGAGCYPSMGVSGIGNDPDALVCVESTPTSYLVDSQISKHKDAIMASTPNLGSPTPNYLQTLKNCTATVEFSPTRHGHLFVVNPAIPVDTALEFVAGEVNNSLAMLRAVEVNDSDPRIHAAVVALELAAAILEAVERGRLLCN